ncbi:hypothetical protein FISHEDRAFT_71128 [Fistulina hepatica ATCC 64428]|nr:hypothetical protein FISHEDRAFT_71128 [Fistulina hepatica ATCC 64428]
MSMERPLKRARNDYVKAYAAPFDDPALRISPRDIANGAFYDESRYIVVEIQRVTASKLTVCCTESVDGRPPKGIFDIKLGRCAEAFQRQGLKFKPFSDRIALSLKGCCVGSGSVKGSKTPQYLNVLFSYPDGIHFQLIRCDAGKTEPGVVVDIKMSEDMDEDAEADTEDDMGDGGDGGFDWFNTPSDDTLLKPSSIAKLQTSTNDVRANKSVNSKARVPAKRKHIPDSLDQHSGSSTLSALSRGSASAMSSGMSKDGPVPAVQPAIARNESLSTCVQPPFPSHDTSESIRTASSAALNATSTSSEGLAAAAQFQEDGGSSNANSNNKSKRQLKKEQLRKNRQLAKIRKRDGLKNVVGVAAKCSISPVSPRQAPPLAPSVVNGLASSKPVTTVAVTSALQTKGPATPDPPRSNPARVPPVSVSDQRNTSHGASFSSATPSQASPVLDIVPQNIMNAMVISVRALDGLYKSSSFDLQSLHRLVSAHSKSSSYWNTIGIVRHTSEPRESGKGDLHCVVELADETLGTTTWSVKVNFWADSYDKLPRPEVGNIMIIKNAAPNRGYPSLIVYKERLQWAILRSDSHEVIRAYMLFDDDLPLTSERARQMEGEDQNEPNSLNKSQVPRPRIVAEEESDEERVRLYRLELGRYCKKLSKWWNKLCSDVVEVQVSGPTYYAGRKHTLIRDLPWNGYFDCTVEILHTFHDERYDVLHVTDYTRVPHEGDLITARKKDITATLKDMTFRIEIWHDDPAYERSKTLEEGQIYSIRNCRARTDQLGNLHGKQVEDKFTKLSSINPNADLQALLERKEAAESKWAVDNKTDYPDRLIEDVETDRFFSCVVEVLHIVRDDPVVLYVTDYTSQPRLKPSYDEDWAKGLDSMIVRILLTDAQARMEKVIKPGTFLNIWNLRLHYNAAAQCLQGQLGGNERLIYPIQSPDKNDILRNLLERKEKWKASNAKPSRPAMLRTSTTISDIMKDTKITGRFQLAAKITDYSPVEPGGSLDEAVFAYCQKCEEVIPQTRRACVKCHDFDHKFVKYRLWVCLVLTDDDGHELLTTLTDECKALFDTPDQSTSEHGLRNALEKFTGIMGGLRGIEKGEAVDAPRSMFTINKWLSGPEKSLNCDIAHFEIM